LLKRARAMRRDMTPGEQRLWRALREADLGGRVRRQVPLGPFIADFYIPAAKLVVEVDGATHDDAAADARRDAWFMERGAKVLRVTNGDVVRNLEGVMTAIALLIASRAALPPQPSPARGEGEG
jgi:very-short-patch-repair endonuclease